MEIHPIIVGLVIAGIVVAIALFRFRNVIARLTLGQSDFSLSAKNEEPQSRDNTRIDVGDVEKSQLDVAGGSRGNSAPKSKTSTTSIRVGSVRNSKVDVTGKDDLRGPLP